MEDKLLEFAEYLRKAGVKVALSEIVDALKGIDEYGITDESRFYLILRATMLKDEVNSDIFDLAYRLYFRDNVDSSCFSNQDDADDTMGGDGVDGTGQGKAGMGGASSQLYNAINKKDNSKIMSMMEDVLADVEIGDLSLEQKLKEIKVRLEWFMVENAYEREGDEGLRNLEVMQDMEEYIRQRLERIYIDEHGVDGLAEILTDRDLQQKDLTALNQQEIYEMEIRIKRLANKLATRYSYRLKPSKSGRINMRKLLSEGAKKGHTPENMFYLDKVKNRPSIVILCDISGSMASYSTFFLQLVYAMSRCFKQVRTFLFVDEIHEASDLLNDSDVTLAIKNAVRHMEYSRIGISNYGEVFELFRDRYLDSLGKEQTMIILGDAKNNWNIPRQEELFNIRSKVAKLIWLNPDPYENWNKDDSIVDTYLPCCDKMVECRNLDQFETAIRQIV